jgi:uroporphyrinogen decarboxylase
MKEPLILRAIKNELVERPPVWIMRQAGRYLPQYRELKKQYGFWEMCSNTSLAVEVSLQPIEFLDVDAVIIFSDILVPIQAMGINVRFAPGPIIDNPIKNASDVDALETEDIFSKVHFVFDIITELKKRKLHNRFIPQRQLLVSQVLHGHLLAIFLTKGQLNTFMARKYLLIRIPN